VYFRDDGKIYIEKKDAKGKLYRYYGKLSNCPVCGEKFFADFAQLRMNKARYCSPQCAQQGISLPEHKEEISLPAETSAPQQEMPLEQEAFTQQQEPSSQPNVPAQQEMPLQEELPLPEEEPPLQRKQTHEIKIGMIGLPQQGHSREDGTISPKRPVGTKIFATLFTYIGFYYLIIGLRIHEGPLEKPKKLILALANILLAYGLVTARSWMRPALKLYLLFVVVATAATYYIALYVNPILKATVHSPAFLVESLIAFVPPIVTLFYVRHLTFISEQFGGQ
jgi:hypothetical protein